MITQSTDDEQILQFIHDKLGFGRVSKQGKHTSRYIVENKKGLELINFYSMEILFFQVNNKVLMNSFVYIIRKLLKEKFC